MKRIKFISILCLVVCLGASCDNNNGPSKDDIKKMKETAQNWMPYLTDNYQVGDSVYFLRTDLATKETQVEGFVVETSIFFERGYEEEDDLLSYRDEENATFSYVIDGYSDEVILKNTGSFLYVNLSVSYDGEEDTFYEYCRLNINFNSCFEVPHYMIDPDYINVTTCSDSCTMQRNVGIIKFSNDQYSWESIKKN
ncbi:MAG: hypothetical protein IJ204_06870 [Paludibacteraceae bacterium]|nr:hypothetical protein [Paludibacteraceae bacterium]